MVDVSGCDSAAVDAVAAVVDYSTFVVVEGLTVSLGEYDYVN